MRYVLSLPRGYRGFEPEDPVPDEFARAYPWAVCAVAECDPPRVQSKDNMTEDGED